MHYVVTGASGFIGKRLVAKLLEREGSIVHFLILERDLPLVESLRERWRVGKNRAIQLVGDLALPNLGVEKSDFKRLRGKIQHLFHLAAAYDLKASAQAQEIANVAGARNTVHFAHEIQAGCFHLFSSIAAAGFYEGVFREDMFDEADHLENPYFRTKHESEAIVRRECRRPWRIYRPGVVVGDSRSGEMDKIDGPYYFFKLIQKVRHLLPPWMPTIGIEGGRLNIVPVDFVVNATDYIAHQEGLDGKCFHLTDPNPRRIGDLLNLFARAGHAPEMSVRVNAHIMDLIPAGVRQALSLLTPVRRIREQIMKDLGLPPDIMKFINYPTRFDCREAQRVLAGSGIEVPPIEDYAWKLWDYWERHLDPDLFIDRSLAGTVKDKVVMITGSGAGIGKAAALKVAYAGAKVIVVDRDQEKLHETESEIKAQGGSAFTYQADLTAMEQCDALVKQVLTDHGGVDILVNNAGRSIRRGIENSYDRFHDFERCMRLNYFGALRVTLGILQSMAQRKQGHIITISSIGVLTNEPRFSAYVASKAAIEAFVRCAANEFSDQGIDFTTINMPLVRTAMTAPTQIYRQVPMLTPDEAAGLVVQAIVYKPERIATKLGIFAELLHRMAPKVSRAIMNTTHRMFPESAAALGLKESDVPPSADQLALAELLRGVHL